MLRDGGFFFRFDGLQSVEVLSYFIRESVLRHIHAYTDRISKTNSVGAAMALDDNPVQT